MPASANDSPRPLSIPRRDFLVLAVLGLLVGVTSYRLSGEVDPRLVTIPAFDVWFEADLPRTFGNMTSRASDVYRANVHPLFALLTYPIVAALGDVLHVRPREAVRVFMAGIAAVWTATLFALLRLIGCRRDDAVLLVLLAVTSAGALFWFIVPETFALGSLGIMFALALVAAAAFRPFGAWPFVAVCVFTLGVTITNGIAGVVAAFVENPPMRAVRYILFAVGALLALWCFEALLFPYTGSPTGYGDELIYLNPPRPDNWLAVIAALFFHTLVMPAIVVAPATLDGGWEMLRVQPSFPGSAGTCGVIAVLLWDVLLILGLGAAMSMSLQRLQRFRLTLGLLLVFQLALHLAYGPETFLYALHFLPLLVSLAALAMLTRLRPLTLAVTVLLIVTATINNGIQLRTALHAVRSHAAIGRTG